MNNNQESKPRTENAILSPGAKSFSDRHFECEPPCDSYGVCSPCIEKSLFQAGFNFGYDAALEKANEKTKELQAKYQKALECLREISSYTFMAADAYESLDCAVNGAREVLKELGEI